MNHDSRPSIRSLVFVPAAITLVVTVVRLALELAGAPAWLANRNAGGAGALIGIAWLPLVFGPWFALHLRPHVTSTRALIGPLAKTLLVYGLLARVPVLLITLPAVLGDWGTHYDTVPGEHGAGAKLAIALAAQLGFWDCIWTVVLGSLAGLLTAAIRFRARPAIG
jgi:hypothetical protein